MMTWVLALLLVGLVDPAVLGPLERQRPRRRRSASEQPASPARTCGARSSSRRRCRSRSQIVASVRHDPGHDPGGRRRRQRVRVGDGASDGDGVERTYPTDRRRSCHRGVRLVAAGTLLAVAVATGVQLDHHAQANGGADFSFVTAGLVRDQSASYGRTLFVMTPYVTLAFAAAVVGRSTLAGVGAGIGVAFIEPLVSSLMRLGGEPWEDDPELPHQCEPCR